jgi:hypothetical protein
MHQLLRQRRLIARNEDDVVAKAMTRKEARGADAERPDQNALVQNLTKKLLVSAA